MKVLLVGGSGYVGSLILPHLSNQFDVHVFDLREPKIDSVEFVAGDVNDMDAVRAAVQGMDRVVYMLMPPRKVGNSLRIAYNLNVMGVHIVMQCARDAGIRRAIYTSSGSVHRDNDVGSETDPMPAASIYGMTKWMGEQVSRWFCEFQEMNIIALRLWRPVARERWERLHLERSDGEGPEKRTLAEDVARAYAAALTCQADGFHPVLISGDYTGKAVNTAYAKSLLGWEPTAWQRSAK